MEAVTFKNFTDKSFTWAYDGMSYTFQPGQEVMLEDFKAFHFAKHLVDQAMNDAGLPTDDPRRKGFEEQCIVSTQEVSPVESLAIEVKKPKKAKKEDVVEFPELNEEETDN
jgi:hypothetical protein